MGSALSTVARIAARACSAAVAPPLESCSLRGSPAVAGLAVVAAAGDGIEADVWAGGWDLILSGRGGVAGLP